MQGMLVILVLVSGVGVKFNTGQFVNCGYNASSEGLKLPTLPPGMGYVDSYLMSKETLPLQGDLNLGISSDREVARKPGVVHCIAEGIGGIIGGVAGSTVGVYLTKATLSFIFRGKIDWSLSSVLSIGTMGACLPGFAEGLALGSAGGVAIIGNTMHKHGSFRKALIGSHVGLMLGGLSGCVAMFLSSAELIGEDEARTVSIGAIISAPIIGAIIGYNK